MKATIIRTLLWLALIIGGWRRIKDGERASWHYQIVSRHSGRLLSAKSGGTRYAIQELSHEYLDR